MKILLVASEVAPFAKTGGLADVAGSLPKALKRMGHDVRIVMPFYTKTQGSGFVVRKGRKSVELSLDGVMHKGFLRQTTLDDIPVYLIENREYFHREYLYGTPAGDYPDNPERFAFFCRGVLQLLKKMDFRPDIIHCNDWQTALIPLLLRHELRTDPFFMKSGVVFTIHNLAFQGLFEKEALPRMGLDQSYFTIDRLEFYGRVNLMKGGILGADIINTVSETYCREILTEEMGCGLDGVLLQRRDDLYGILNGIDYDLWDPATDRELFRNYTAANPAAKALNKNELQRRLGLEQAPDVPLLGIVSRLTAQKGFDLLDVLLPCIAGERLQLVILGTGDEPYMRSLQKFKKRGAANISVNLGFEAELANMVYAGSDMFLMPSRFEPCGIGQLIAFRYGAVPVVRRTGGLADTVVDPRDNEREANGFVFEEYTPEAFWEAISRAVQAYAERKGWNRIVRQGMASDFSWRHSASRYEELYRLALAKKVL